MLEHAYRDLYNSDSSDKQISITFDYGEITNSELYQDGVELTENLCSESELKFGSCEASTFKIKIANTFDNFKGKWLTVKEVINGDSENELQLGRYKVYSDVPSGDRNYRNITAYDAMYDIINTEVSTWYESLVFPLTQKEFRDSFFKFFGIEQEEVDLINDGLQISKTIQSDSISGKDVICAICELNGVFGHINRSGKFEYITLGRGSDEPIEIDKSLYSSCEFEDFVTNKITKVQIRQEENDIGASYGEDGNCYIVEDNFLVYGMSSTELQSVAKTLYEKINSISYRPYSATVKGNPCHEVGDFIRIDTRNGIVESYILKRTLSGIQALTDMISAEGTEEISNNTNSVEKKISALRGKTNVLERSVEETKSTIKDVENDLESQILQTANAITLLIKQGKINEEQIAKIALEVSRALNNDGISKNSAVEFYETEEIPTLSNYPVVDEFYLFDKCSDALLCSETLLCGTNDYASHLGEVVKDGSSNLYYIFENEDGEYAWRQLTEAEVEKMSERSSSVKVTEYGVTISSKYNEESAQLVVTSKGVNATVLYCC